MKNRSRIDKGNIGIENLWKVLNKFIGNKTSASNEKNVH